MKEIMKPWSGWNNLVGEGPESDAHGGLSPSDKSSQQFSVEEHDKGADTPFLKKIAERIERVREDWRNLFSALKVFRKPENLSSRGFVKGALATILAIAAIGSLNACTNRPYSPEAPQAVATATVPVEPTPTTQPSPTPFPRLGDQVGVERSVLDPFKRGSKDSFVDMPELERAQELLVGLAESYPELPIKLLNEKGMVEVMVGADEVLLGRLSEVNGRVVVVDEFDRPQAYLLDETGFGKVEKVVVDGGEGWQVGEETWIEVVGEGWVFFDVEKYQWNGVEWVERLPEGVRHLKEQLVSVWNLSPDQISYRPATQGELVSLAQALDKEVTALQGVQVVVDEETGAQFYVVEEDRIYVLRQVFPYTKYKNGEPIDVPAHWEGVALAKVINKPREFSHWGDGRHIIKVEDEAGQDQYWYLDLETGQWRKIYESGFDYEAIYQASVQLLMTMGKISSTESVAPEEVRQQLRELGKGYLDGVGYYFEMKGAWSAGAYIDTEAPWWSSKLFGINMGETWVRLTTQKGKEVNALVVYVGEPYNKEGDLGIVPVLLGMERDGEGKILLSEIYGVFSAGYDSKPAEQYFQDLGIVEQNFGRQENQGLGIFVEPITWMTRDGLVHNQTDNLELAIQGKAGCMKWSQTL